MSSRSAAETLARSGASAVQIRIIDSHKNAAKELLDAGDEFVFAELGDAAQANFRLFHANHCFNCVGPAEGDTSAKRWRLKTHVREYIRERVDGLRTAPCGHTGVSNLGDGEYGCGFEGCDETFGRDVAREVIK